MVLHAPQIPCIDQNGDISEFRIRYAKSSDFIAGVEIRNGLFTPGLVIVGNLDSGTDYTFQLIIVTAEGGSVSLEPLTVRTYGKCPNYWDNMSVSLSGHMASVLPIGTICQS